MKKQWAACTEDRTLFSKNVMPYCRGTPFSNAYLQGDAFPSEGGLLGSGLGRHGSGQPVVNPQSAARLAWHQALHKLGVQLQLTPDEFRPIMEAYCVQTLHRIEKLTRSNPNYKSQPERYPHIQELLQIFDETNAA